MLITCCQGGSIGVEVLNLWGAATFDAGRLPASAGLASQLQAAGFQIIENVPLAPGEALFAFKACR